MANPMACGCFLFISLFLYFSSSLALTDGEVAYIVRRQLLTLPEDGDLKGDMTFELDFHIKFENSRLKRAYVGLQAWKKAIYSDPQNFTANWDGPDVCAYNGVFCAPALDDPKTTVVAGVDLNHADIAGHLPVEIGLLTDVSLLHMNSNRFCGIIPKSLSKLTILYELDLSNNRFVGPFPKVVLDLPTLKYLDIRYNDFEGSLPPELFHKDLDAIFCERQPFSLHHSRKLWQFPSFGNCDCQ
ncbi:Pollen-specific leucine-rich repeat extensin-like protein 1 [Abeliophyllum distichum]|uniref:Cell wall hydroxyproline-rich glycoprotein n=1 Tax=Abeliophyllum distichum TaxID=126358 RepID=A0ABD1NNS9_9LAMI